MRFVSPMALPNQNIAMSALVIMLILRTSTTSKQKENNMLSYNLSARYNDQHHIQISNFVKNYTHVALTYQHSHDRRLNKKFSTKGLQQNIDILSVIVIYQTKSLRYNALLYASLTVSTTHSRYNDIHELLSDEKVHFFASESMHKFLVPTGTNLAIKIWKRMKKSEIIKKNEEKIKLLSLDNNAIIHTYERLLYDFGTKCEFTIIKIPISSATYFRFPKGSKYLDTFNQKLLKLMESGILGKIVEDKKQETHCKQTDYNNVKAISFRHTVTAFLILVVGVLCSAIVLILEVFLTCL
uniref:Ionotropic glutamate receptor C-terminal domain-containing protein n=1 Tax=Strigamia maritima TaxID=126957 RepID=T1IWZ4_STRMM